MPYLGQSPHSGEDNNFKILDTISSYTFTFDGSDSGVVSTSNETIYSVDHRFITGQRVKYTNGGGGDINGLTNNSYYFIIKQDKNNIQLATSAANAISGTAINITAVGSGTSHTLNVAFDGVNTKFKATHTSGQKARITRASQLVLSVNGVIQQPHDSTSPSTGFGIDSSNIVFSQAPASTDAFWGHILTNNNVTFDISDNKVDHFSGDGSTVAFTLSKSPSNNENVLVTIDGVVQYPNDSAGNIRAYSVTVNVISFTTAPGSGTQIEVRHIGFAGATTGDTVTGFYGRTGNASLKNTDNITVNDAAITGDATVSGNTTITGDLTVNGTTVTLDTKLTEVDQILVGANNSTVAVAVTQSGAGDLLQLFDGASQVVTVDDEGNIGINKADPNQLLHIAATGDGPFMRLQNTDVTIAGGQTFGGIEFQSTDSSSGCSGVISKIQSLATGTFDGTSANGGALTFHTSQTNPVSLQERLRITPAGKVGIGTDNPDRIVHVFEPTENNLLFLESGDTNVDIIQADTGGSTRIRNSQGSLVFYVNGDASSSSAANAVTGLTIDGDKDVHVYDDLFIPDKIIHEGDTNTAIRFPAADTFSVETAGQQNVQVNGTRVLLKSPSGTNTTVRLQHQGNSGYGDIILDRTVNAFIIDNDPSNASNNQSYFSVKNKGTENLRITSTGAVGINSTTPTANYKLDVNGDLTLGEWKGVSNTFIDQKQDGDLHLINSGRTAQGASGSPGTAGVGINRFNNISGGTSLFRDFAVYNGKDSKVLVVDGSTSRVGVGTDDPAYELHVHPGGASSSGQICAQSEGNNTFAELVLKTDGGTGSIWRNSSAKTTYGGANSLNIYQSAAANISFFTNGNNERLRITSGGSALFGGLTSQVGGQDTSKLAVQGGGSNIGIIQVHAGGGESAGDLSGIAFSHGADNTTARAKAAIALEAIASYGKGDLCFYVDGANDNNQVAAADEKLRITTDGTIFINRDANGGRLYATGGNLYLQDGNGRQTFRVDAMASGTRTSVLTGGGCLSIGTANPGQPNVPGIHIESDESDDCRIAFVTTNKANTRIGYYGLSNRFGIDMHNGFQIRDAGQSYATRLLVSYHGQLLQGTESQDQGWAVFQRSASGGADAGTAGQDGAGDKGVNIRADMGPTHTDLTGVDNYTLKLHNAAYAGTGVSNPQGSIAKILFNTGTYNGWNAYGAIALDTQGASAGRGELTFMTNSGTSIMSERLRIESGGTIRTIYGVQTGGNATGGFKFTSNYSGKGFDIATQYATQGNGGSNGADPMFSGWWGSTNTFRVNSSGQIKFGASLNGQVQSGSFSVNAGATKTITVSGMISGAYIFQGGTYSSSGQGQGGIHFTDSGYHTATYTHDIHEIKKWNNGGGTGITISGISKNSSSSSFTVQNSHGSFNAGFNWHIWGNDEVVVTIS